MASDWTCRGLPIGWFLAGLSYISGIGWIRPLPRLADAYMTTNGKVCSRCGEMRSLEFWKPIRNGSGRISVGKICLICRRSSAVQRAKKKKDLNPEECKSYMAKWQRKKRGSMSAEERHVMRLGWKEMQGRPCRMRGEIAQQAIDKEIAALNTKIGITCWENWYKQSHTIERWYVECRFLGKKPWRYPGNNAAQAYAQRYRTDREFNIKERIRRQIIKATKEVYGTANLSTALKRSNSTSSLVEQLVGCSASDLKSALIDSIKGTGYTWDNFMSGELHIDHIIPKSMFNVVGDVKEARLCWNINNLRLISADYNMSKSNKIVASMIDTRKEVFVC